MRLEHVHVFVSGALLVTACGSKALVSSTTPAKEPTAQVEHNDATTSGSVGELIACLRAEFRPIGNRNCLPPGYSRDDLPQFINPATTAPDDIVALVASSYLISGDGQCFPSKDRYSYLKANDLLAVTRYPTLSGVEYVKEDVIQEISAELASALSAEFSKVSSKFEAELRSRIQQTANATADTSGTLQCYGLSIKGAFSSQGAIRFDQRWDRFHPCRGDLLTVGVVGCLATGFKQTARTDAVSQFEQAAQSALAASLDTKLITADVKAKVQSAVQRGLTRKEEFNATVPDTFFIYGVRRLVLPSDAPEPESGQRCIPGTVKATPRSKETSDPTGKCERSVDNVSRPGADPAVSAVDFKAKTFTWVLAQQPLLECTCAGYEKTAGRSGK